jgi:hypothetical protein
MCKRPSSTFVDNVRPSHATQFQSSYVLSRVPPSYPSANPQPSQTLPSESSELLVYSPKSLFNKCSSSALYSSSISKPSRSKAPSSSPLQRLCSSPVPLPCRHSLVVEQPTQSLLSPALLALHLRPPQFLSGRTKQLLGTIGERHPPASPLGTPLRLQSLGPAGMSRLAIDSSPLRKLSHLSRCPMLFALHLYSLTYPYCYRGHRHLSPTASLLISSLKIHTNFPSSS